LDDLACSAARYLLRRGDFRNGHELASRLYQQRHDQHGPDDLWTLASVHVFAAALRGMGRYRETCQLDEDTLARRRRVLGSDHPDTLATARNLAQDLRALGELQAARDLVDEDTLAGASASSATTTLIPFTAAHNLAETLCALGDSTRDL
jgi:hypothetical protein